MTVLVAYASKHGSTAEIAQAIAETLNRSGLPADCIQAAAVHSLEPYDAVVLGSAVYTRRWRGDARHFLRRLAHELSERPLWVFSSGPVGPPNPDEVDSPWLEPRRTIEAAERLGARDHVVFGGRMPTEPRGPAQRGMVNNCPPEFRDRRDWERIRAWAEAIAAQLRPPVTSP